jgi:foldase protein PrsA
MRKKTRWMIFLFCILLGNLTGCRIGNTEYVLYEQKVDSKTVFSVNDTKCSLKEAKIYLCNYKNIYGNAYGLDLWETGEYHDSLENYVKDVSMAELTRVICMDLLAEEQGIALDEEETAAVAKLAKEYYDSLTDEERDFMDVRTSDVQLAYEHYAIAMKLYATLTDGVNEEVSDDEARVIRLQQIFLTDPDIAQMVAQKLENGEDFASVAAAYNRGSTVEVTVARGDYPKEVEDVAFNLDEGASSSMIETDNGYYFVKCLSRFEESLTEANKANILIRREKEQFDDLYDEFLNSCEFEQNDALWEAVSLEGTTGIATDSFFARYDDYYAEE